MELPSKRTIDSDHLLVSARFCEKYGLSPLTVKAWHSKKRYLERKAKGLVLRIGKRLYVNELVWLRDYCA